jgi:hypothetical protein
MINEDISDKTALDSACRLFLIKQKIKACSLQQVERVTHLSNLRNDSRKANYLRLQNLYENSSKQRIVTKPLHWQMLH